MKILYCETFDDHIPIYCELVFSNYAFAESVNPIIEVKFNIVWDEFSDDQFEAHGYILDSFSVELWADFLSCNKISYDNALHHQQMDHLYSALVDSVNLASNNLVKTFQHREKDITGWNRFCKKITRRCPK